VLLVARFDADRVQLLVGRGAADGMFGQTFCGRWELLANRVASEARADETVGTADGMLTDRSLVGRGVQRSTGVRAVTTGGWVTVLGDASRKQDLIPAILEAPGLLKPLGRLAGVPVASMGETWRGERRDCDRY
jgi:hypothetical protein